MTEQCSPGIVERLDKAVLFRGLGIAAYKSVCADAKAEIERLRAAAQSAPSRDQIAKAIYAVEPFYEGGEYVDAFQVSPGGALSWEQALARDAEFASEKFMLPITKFAFDAADAVLALSSTQRPTQGE